MADGTTDGAWRCRSVEDRLMKVGIIRCRQTEEICGSTSCLAFAAKGKGAFEPFGPCEVSGIVSCGGCPGKSAPARAKMLRDHGAEAIVFASCITLGTPIGFPCPNRDMMIQAVRRKLGDGVPVLDYTHPAPPQKKPG